MTFQKKRMLMVFADLTDNWRDEPLHDAIVRVLERHGLAGASVYTGIMGFGRHRRIHSKGLFGMVDSKPVTVVCIDDEEKIMAVLPIIFPMVAEGLVSVHDVDVVTGV
ncbi:MAG: DUF190 domain-containing protein [Bryobacterales bacterium]|nr:DUF190 domain-containing protein [Bryobacterales bacterium]